MVVGLAPRDVLDAKGAEVIRRRLSGFVDEAKRHAAFAVGGGVGVTDENLNENYVTHCDPRLNNQQALELAFVVAGYLRKRRNAA